MGICDSLFKYLHKDKFGESTSIYSDFQPIHGMEKYLEFHFMFLLILLLLVILQENHGV